MEEDNGGEGMSRYFDADKLKSEFPIRRNNYDEEHGDVHFINGIESVFEYIDYMPTADVEKVRHGEWIFGVTMNHEWMKCSECLVSQTPTGVFVYCPNCGAKMDGGAQ